MLLDEFFGRESIRKDGFGAKNEEPNDKALPSCALFLQPINKCFLILAVFCPLFLLINGIFLRFHELDDHLLHLLLDTVEIYHSLDESKIFTIQHSLRLDCIKCFLKVDELNEKFL